MNTNDDNNNNDDSNNLTKNCTREQDREAGKTSTMAATSTTTTMRTTTTYQQPPRRRFPEHSTIGKLTTSSTAYKWNDNIDNNDNNYNYTAYKNSKSLPVSSSWVNDPEIKRQRRIVKYKAYAVEGKMKSSIKSGFRWVKNKYCQLVHGY